MSKNGSTLFLAVKVKSLWSDYLLNTNKMWSNYALSSEKVEEKSILIMAKMRNKRNKKDEC